MTTEPPYFPVPAADLRAAGVAAALGPLAETVSQAQRQLCEEVLLGLTALAPPEAATEVLAELDRRTALMGAAEAVLSVSEDLKSGRWTP